MLTNYLKIAWRSLVRNKTNTGINIFGLTVGLSSCLLIGLYIQHELSFDAFQPNGNRIVRLIMEYGFDGSKESNQGNFTSTKVAPVFARTFPEVQSAVRMTANAVTVRYGEKLVRESNFMFADSSFFDLFTAQFRLGNPRKALDGPNKVIVTESTAQKYFGTQNPLGKILLIGSDSTAYQVTGVMADYPTNSQLKFDFLASFSSLKANQEDTYFNANYTTYLLLKNEQSVASLEAKIKPFMQKEMAGSGAFITFHPEVFSRIHLHSNFPAFVPNTPVTYLYMLSGVALLILLIVGFTYINLSTARSLERAREVGIRKVAGAHKSQLFWQYIGESGLVCAIALVLSLLVAAIALPSFRDLTQTPLAVQALFSPSFLSFAFLAALVMSLLAGSYPALVLTAFQPVQVLKGLFKHTGSSRRMQQSLIVFQFSIAIALLVGTFIIERQLAFIQEKKLGYDRTHVLVLPISPIMQRNLSAIKQELKANPDIISASRCVSTPVRIEGGYNMRSATMSEKAQMSVMANPVDEDYIKTAGLQLVAGENLTEQDVRDVLTGDPKVQKQYHFVLNESAARQLGWTPQQAVGQRMFLDNSRPGLVRGVVRDFHFESFHTTIKPLVLFPEDYGRQLLVKVSGRNLPQTLAFVEAKWKQIAPYMPFEYRFLDDDYARLYQSEQQLGTVMNLFSSIALLLTCLGLLGLSAYVVQQRTKEIGVRKVLGASVFSIVTLLSSDFIKLVLIAIMIASPLAWWAMHTWLQDFAYKIDIAWWIFAGAGALAVGIALLTVSFQSVKAALMNPVKSLRSE
ncbi:ABC transporter permease [uncultured Fibrella sp.]|uniref:ABC transporter permease n=1 Tax=uncultured Fibrella sp. TaxID=1284596 RepID=UPI0035C9D1D0